FERLNEFLSNDLKENKVTLTSEVNPSSLELTADQVMIEQVLINMIINSIQALQGKSDKTITLSSNMNDKGRVVIKIHDNGTGIPPEVQEKIFIPFFSTKSSGSGIGLSLARQILRAHGGNIRVQSKPNEGTTFSLFF
ncbi:MAG: GHKL domain-containing protein, partial [Melioribacteraceae bacterium]|nr:GHKL domain-containing protein [Melioribacteraceae bacterium]